MTAPPPHPARFDTQTHASLLARLIAPPGDHAQQAWREFVDRYGDLIAGFCRARGLHSADTDDIVQDVLLALTRAMPDFTYDPAKGKFRSYLKTVTLHAIFKKSRQRAGQLQLGDAQKTLQATSTPHHPSAESDPPSYALIADALTHDPHAESQWETQWRRYHLRRAMLAIEHEFSARDRDAFERYAVLGQEPTTIARELSISTENLYKIKSRLTRRLAELIALQIEEEG
jgi:RNA polymerase sigma factor (sigma-70 family)